MTLPTIIALSLSAFSIALASTANFAPATQAAPAKASSASTYEIDDTHSMALFRVQHMGAGAFWGMFNDVKGTVTYAAGSELSFDVTIDAQSVDSNNAKLDQHLKSPDFFNTKEFPAMTFKRTSSKMVSEGKWEVTGDLTIRGKSKSVTVPIECLGEVDMGMGKRAGFEAEFTINRGDFGVNYGVEKGALSNATRVIVAIEGVANRAAAEK